MKKCMLLMCCLCQAAAFGAYIEVAAQPTAWIDDVEIVPTQPSDGDMILLDISGQAIGLPSRVAADSFLQNGTWLQWTCMWMSAFSG